MLTCLATNPLPKAAPAQHTGTAMDPRYKQVTSNCPSPQRKPYYPREQQGSSFPEQGDRNESKKACCSFLGRCTQMQQGQKKGKQTQPTIKINTGLLPVEQ